MPPPKRPLDVTPVHADIKEHLRQIAVRLNLSLVSPLADDLDFGGHTATNLGDMPQVDGTPIGQWRLIGTAQADDDSAIEFTGLSDWDVLRLTFRGVGGSLDSSGNSFVLRYLSGGSVLDTNYNRIQARVDQSDSSWGLSSGDETFVRLGFDVQSVSLDNTSALCGEVLISRANTRALVYSGHHNSDNDQQVMVGTWRRPGTDVPDGIRLLFDSGNIQNGQLWLEGLKFG